MTRVFTRCLLGIALSAAPTLASAGSFTIADAAGITRSFGAASDGTNFLVSFQDAAAQTTGARLISPAGTVLATVTLATGDPPVVAWDGANYLLAWVDHSGPNAPVLGAIIAPNGTKAAGPFGISQTSSAEQVTGLAFDGTNYLVAWTDRRRVTNPEQPGQRDVYARLVSGSAFSIGSEFKVSTSSGKDAGVAFAAPDFLVAWGDEVASEVRARLVTPAAVLEPDFLVAAANRFAAFPDDPIPVATDGTGFLVVWDDAVAASDHRLVGQRITSAGALSGAAIPVAGAARPLLRPYLGFDGANFLVAWTDFRNDLNGNGQCDAGETPCLDVRGRFVSASGALVGSPFPIAAGAGNEGESPVAYGGGRYLVVFNENFRSSDSDLEGTFVPVDLVFRDDFESGTLLAWSAAAADGGDLAANGTSPLGGAYDMTGVVNDTSPLYVEDDGPVDEDHYRARFRIDARDFDPGMSQGHFRVRTFIVFEEAPTRRLVAVVLKRQGAQVSLEARTRRDDNSQADTGFFPIASGPHAVEIEWKRASTSLSGDGELRLWIDDTLVSTLTGLQNHVSSVDFVRLGALSVKTGASGRLSFDDFESRRSSYIGP